MLRIPLIQHGFNLADSGTGASMRAQNGAGHAPFDRLALSEGRAGVLMRLIQRRLQRSSSPAHSAAPMLESISGADAAGTDAITRAAIVDERAGAPSPTKPVRGDFSH